MELEELVPALAVALFGVAVWLGATGLIRSPARPDRSERSAWWHLALPCFAGLIAVAFCAGWAAQEPDPSDESMGSPYLMVVALSAVVLVRALVRAGFGMRPPLELSVGAVGLWRPNIVVSDPFRSLVSPEALEAALAHEQAHVRGHDPLRVWMAHLIADLQWPIPGARRRLAAWRLALEIKRDDEALADGADPLYLAQAILAAAKLPPASMGTAAPATGDGSGIEVRVRRLFSARAVSAADHPQRYGWLFRGAAVGLILGATWLGFTTGDVILRAILGAHS